MAVKTLLVTFETQIDLQRLDRIAEQTFGLLPSSDDFLKIIHIECPPCIIIMHF
jgi:hypothetical protein